MRRYRFLPIAMKLRPDGKLFFVIIPQHRINITTLLTGLRSFELWSDTYHRILYGLSSSGSVRMNWQKDRRPRSLRAHLRSLDTQTQPLAKICYGAAGQRRGAYICVWIRLPLHMYLFMLPAAFLLPECILLSSLLSTSTVYKCCV